MELVLLVLMVFLILGSLVALEMRDLLSAVIAVGVVGLGLAIVFLLMGAPDIAITQVVVEVIIVTVLIRAAGRTGRVEPKGAWRDRMTVGVGVLVLLACMAFLIAAFAEMPRFGKVPGPGEPGARPSTWYLEKAPSETGATNVVTAILLDFRAYDTLGEATVILAAVIGALAILRRPARRKREGAPPAASEDTDAGAPAKPELSEVAHG